MAWLIEPPSTFDLPVSRGGDFQAVFVYKPVMVDGLGDPVLDANGNLQYSVASYPTGAFVTLTIDALPTPISGLATVVGSRATVVIDKALTDTVKDYQLWRLVMTVDTLDTVLANGQVIRADGTPL